MTIYFPLPSCGSYASAQLRLTFKIKTTAHLCLWRSLESYQVCKLRLCTTEHLPPAPAISDWAQKWCKGSPLHLPTQVASRDSLLGAAPESGAFTTESSFLLHLCSQLSDMHHGWKASLAFFCFLSSFIFHKDYTPKLSSSFTSIMVSASQMIQPIYQTVSRTMEINKYYSYWVIRIFPDLLDN